MLDESRQDEQRGGRMEFKNRTNEDFKTGSADSGDRVAGRKLSHEEHTRSKRTGTSDEEPAKEPFGNSVLTDSSDFRARIKSSAEDSQRRSRLQTRSIDNQPGPQSAERQNIKFESSGIQSLIKNSNVNSQKSNKNLMDQAEANDPNNDSALGGMGSIKSTSRTFNVSHLLGNSKEHKSKSNNIKLTRISNSKNPVSGSSLLSKVKQPLFQNSKLSGFQSVATGRTTEEPTTSRSFNQSIGNDPRKSLQDQQAPLRMSKEVLFKKQGKVSFSHNQQYFSANDEKGSQGYFNYEQS